MKSRPGKNGKQKLFRYWKNFLNPIKRALRACMATIGSVAGGTLTTIEGLAQNGELHPVQQAFVDESAMQCGYCIPGFIMTAVGLLDRDASPSSAQIREALAENMCRCGTYMRIQRAVERASGQEGDNA